MRHQRLGLHQEVLLLALKDEQGVPFSGTWHCIALGGAVLSELMLRDIVKVDDEGKKSFLKLVNKKRTGDDVLDEAIDKIACAKRRATLRTWVTRMSQIKQLRHRVARQLCDLKILRANEKQVLLIFKQRIYPERDHGPEREILARIKDAVFSTGQDADPRTIVLLSLAHSSGLLRKLFDKRRLKSRKAHIEKVVAGATLGNATKQAIEAAQAAVMVAAMVPAITAATVH